MRISDFGAGILLALTAGITNAQFPPKPEGLKILESRFGDGVTISYKEVG
jgi:carboxypeptidase C (cathepsin A)